MLENREQIIFCFCGPTASGKSTICRRLLAIDSHLHLSISTTTRSPREGEKDGADYYFVTDDEFKKRISEDKFIEHATFNKNRYGTEKRNLEEAAAKDSDALFDIEVQGVEQLKSLYGRRVVTIFVFPPSFDVLVERLKKRGTEDEDKMKQRLSIAKKEIAVLTKEGFADYFLVNDSLDSAVVTAERLISAERTKMNRLIPTALDEIIKDA